MDLVTVRKSDFSLNRLVEDHRSLIWTERFQDPCDFQLNTFAVGDTRQLLPERSLVTLRDTNVVMMVLNHKITTGDDGIEELQVTGKSLDWFLNKREWHGAAYGKSTKMHQSYTVRQAVEAWIWNAIVNATGDDVINTSISRAVGNAIPNVVVSDSVPASSDGSSKVRKVKNGLVYDQMRTFLSAGKLGIRIIRPNGTSGKRVDIGSGGGFSTTHVDDFTKLRFDIYQGRDKTDSVVFSWKAGHLDKPTYLWDSEAYRGGVYVDGDPRKQYVTDPDAVPGSNTGWNRMDGYLDAGTKDDGMTADEFEESLEDSGLRALRKDYKHISLIDAQISPFINYKYGKDYRLGDRVRVNGKYGVNQNMWVVEYVRTQDENGEVGYPTLSVSPS